MHAKSLDKHHFTLLGNTASIKFICKSTSSKLFTSPNNLASHQTRYLEILISPISKAANCKIARRKLQTAELSFRSHTYRCQGRRDILQPSKTLLYFIVSSWNCFSKFHVEERCRIISHREVFVIVNFESKDITNHDWDF